MAEEEEEDVDTSPKKGYVTRQVAAWENSKQAATAFNPKDHVCLEPLGGLLAAKNAKNPLQKSGSRAAASNGSSSANISSATMSKLFPSAPRQTGAASSSGSAAPRQSSARRASGSAAAAETSLSSDMMAEVQKLVSESVSKALAEEGQALVEDLRQQMHELAAEQRKQQDDLEEAMSRLAQVMEHVGLSEGSLTSRQQESASRRQSVDAKLAMDLDEMKRRIGAMDDRLAFICQDYVNACSDEALGNLVRGTRSTQFFNLDRRDSDADSYAMNHRVSTGTQEGVGRSASIRRDRLLSNMTSMTDDVESLYREEAGVGPTPSDYNLGEEQIKKLADVLQACHDDVFAAWGDVSESNAPQSMLAAISKHFDVFHSDVIPMAFATGDVDFHSLRAAFLLNVLGGYQELLGRVFDSELDSVSNYLGFSVYKLTAYVDAIFADPVSTLEQSFARAVARTPIHGSTFTKRAGLEPEGDEKTRRKARRSSAPASAPGHKETKVGFKPAEA